MNMTGLLMHFSSLLMSLSDRHSGLLMVLAMYS